MHKENPLHRHTMYDFKTHVSAACSYRTFLLTTERKHFMLYKKHVVGHRRRTKSLSLKGPHSPLNLTDSQPWWKEEEEDSRG